MLISLHHITLEWLKYMTDKPPLYTVYRTKGKTVRKEMIGKRDKF